MVSNKQAITERVNAAELNQEVDLSDVSRLFENVEFSEESDGTYLWSAYSKYSPTWQFPMRNSQYVKTFKTLTGCKRNFLRRVQ